MAKTIALFVHRGRPEKIACDVMFQEGLRFLGLFSAFVETEIFVIHPGSWS